MGRPETEVLKAARGGYRPQVVWQALGPANRIPLGLKERRILLALFDLLALTLSFALSLHLRRDSIPAFRALQLLVWFLWPSLVWFVAARTFDMYDPTRPTSVGGILAGVSKAAALTYLAFLLLPYFMPGLPARRLALLLPFLVLWAAAAGLRLLYLRFFDRPAFARNVVVLGAGWAGRTIAELLLSRGNHSFRILGFVDDDPAKWGTVVISPKESSPDDPVEIPVLGDRSVLRELMQSGVLDAVILAVTHDVDGDLFQLLMDGLEKGIEVVPMPTLYEQLTGRIPIEHVGENWYVAMPVRAVPSAAWVALKRLMDVVLAGAGALFLVLVLPFIALAIRLDSPGPVFYTQWRVGKGGKLFRIVKFRSMVRDAENGRAVWARPNDARVTRVGKLLRKTHLDEFPQFWNILRGEMSVVGPRPERPEFVEELAREIPFYRVRHAVKPGMAGWALVKHGYVSSKEDAMLRLQYDLYYIKHQSLWLDLEILLKTFLDTLKLRGRA
jgi:exopolysaccharide biosynthesis polyprenyl glycosylphosphotransferase